MSEQMMVKVHYTGRLEDGTVFDSSEGKDPMVFNQGAGQVIPGFEEAVAALEVGQKTTVTLPPEKAYGQRDESLIQQAPVDQIPDADKLPVGEYIYFEGPGGMPVPALVQKIEDGIAYFDFNPELAGKTLIFDLELIDRVPVSVEDTKMPEGGCDCSSCSSGCCG